MNAASLKVRISLAYGCIYLVWGTTYLGIALAIRTLPPFTSGAMRFLLAATIMSGWLWLCDRGQLRDLPWRHALLSGVLLGGIGNGFVVWSQQGLPSGIAALMVSAVPVVVLLLNWAFFERRPPGGRAMAGTGLALAGVVTIVATRHGVGGEASLTYVFTMIVAVLAWSTGTLLQRRSTNPAQLFGVTTVQMLGAGLFLTFMALASREWVDLDLAHVSAASLGAVVYLAVFGSIVALTCYVWLLTQEPAQKVATYALVNPVVAMLLGAIVLGETITGSTVTGASLVLAGVALVLFGNLRIPRLALALPRGLRPARPVPRRMTGMPSGKKEAPCGASMKLRKRFRVSAADARSAGKASVHASLPGTACGPRHPGSTAG